MNRKKRILVVGEGSPLVTGFSKLTYEILKRLYKTEKYDIIEIGSYIKTSDPRNMDIPWPVIGAVPEDNDQAGHQKYNSNMYAQFGSEVFDPIALEYQVDIVIDVRDDWMCSWQLDSPFRKYFKLIWMPTVDGKPQERPWLEHYSQADLLLTYSKFGKDTLEEESGGKLKVFDIVRPGMDHEVYKPLNKNQLREKYNISKNANVIMMLCRNQKRKLYYDLIEMFKGFLDYCIKKNNKELAQNTFLFCHTSFPDVGYPLDQALIKTGIGNKVLFTYTCENCRQFYIDYFQTELTTCKYCGVPACHMPNSSHGIDTYGLAELLNISDLYIQYSISEGLGMGICEAKACGIPSMAVDYSAMSEQVNIDGCIPIKVERFFWESVLETGQKRALPDNEDTYKKIYKFLTLPQKEKDRMGKLAQKDAVDNYSFDRAAKIWEKAIDSIDIYDHNETWLNPKPRYAPLNTNIPNNLKGNGELVDWCIINIIGQPDKLTSYWRNELVKALNVGFLVSKQGRENFDPQKLIQMMIGIAQDQNYWEDYRIHRLVPQDQKQLSFEVI